MRDATEYDVADVLRNVNNPDADHTNVQKTLINYNIAAIAIVTVTISVRTLVRALVVRHVTAEDFLMLAAGLAAIALSVMIIIGAGYGIGANVWDINLATIIQDVQLCIQTLFICQCLHATALASVKLSIISTYWRIFPTKFVRWTLFSIATAVAAVAVGSIFGTIFQCQPIAGAWNFNLERQCFRIEDLFYFSTAFSVFTDVVLCILPLPFCWKLNISKREKIMVSCLFCLGLFAAAASIVRLTTLGRLRNINATMVAIPALNWSVAEVITGIVCACLPCLKPLLNKLVPAVLVYWDSKPSLPFPADMPYSDGNDLLNSGSSTSTQGTYTLHAYGEDSPVGWETHYLEW